MSAAAGSTAARGRAAVLPARAPWQRLAALGDSLVAGVGDPVKGLEHRPWVDRVFDAVAGGRPGVEALNVGVRDALLGSILADQLPQVLAADPDLVLVNGGGNDFLRSRFDPDATAAAYRRLVGTLADGRRTVVTFTMFEVTKVIAYPEPFAGRLDERYPWIQGLVRDVARELGCVLIDFGADDVPLDLDMWSADRLHLNARGHAVAADVALRALAEHLSRPGAGRTAAPPPR